MEKKKHREKNYFRSRGDRIANVIIVIILVLFFIIELYPMWFVLIASISDPKLVSSNQIVLIPKQITFEGYQLVFQNKDIWTGYMNSIIYAVVGTFLNLFHLLTCAFAMSRQPSFKGKAAIMGIFVFTMYFSGGLIPYYLFINSLGLINTRLVLVLPGALSVYNMIIVRTYFQSSIPTSVYEAARIDGANDLQVFVRIAIPLAKPIIAVMTLFCVVGHWNSYFPAMIFLQDAKKFPLQLILRNILVLNQNLKTMSFANLTPEEILNLARKQELAESIKYAVIYVSSIPMLVAYPFVQKHFVKGIMVGAIKG